MKNLSGYLIALLLILSGGVLIWIGLERPVQIITPEGIITVDTRAWQVESVLAEAEVALSAYDQVVPPPGSKTAWRGIIHVRRASLFRIIDLSRNLDISIPSPERLPANILKDAGVALFPGDRILWNGQSVDMGRPLPHQAAYVLQIISSFKVALIEDDHLVTKSSAAASLGQALWEHGVGIQTTDILSTGLQTPLRFLETVYLQRAKPMHVRVDDRVIEAMAAAESVGEALNRAGIWLQGMDYSIPPEDMPLPVSGRVEVVRVHEEVVLEQTVLPYTSEAIMDPETPLDQRRIIESGQYGLMISRERIRYENSTEALRTKDAEWVAAEPVRELIGIGSQVILATVDTPQGPMEYWRSLTAYATSYSPCRVGTGECSYTTAIGLELKKGVIAVKCSLLSSMRGQQVYIPGYGVAVIGDCGGGVAGSFWVDLGFSDEDYESWHQTVTVYFLAPVPATIPYELQ